MRPSGAQRRASASYLRGWCSSPRHLRAREKRRGCHVPKGAMFTSSASERQRRLRGQVRSGPQEQGARGSAAPAIAEARRCLPTALFGRDPEATAAPRGPEWPQSKPSPRAGAPPARQTARPRDQSRGHGPSTSEPRPSPCLGGPRGTISRAGPRRTWLLSVSHTCVCYRCQTTDSAHCAPSPGPASACPGPQGWGASGPSNRQTHPVPASGAQSRRLRGGEKVISKGPVLS